MKTRSYLYLLFTSLFISTGLFGHCQVPCGIYADEVVFGELETDVATIEKAMVQIEALTVADPQQPNQLVRWVNNKEAHALNIQETMSAYFLAQRIKLSLRDSDPERYAKLVGLAHEITVLAMKCKQGTDSAHASALHDALHAFQEVYAN